MIDPLPIRVGHLDSAVDPDLVRVARRATTDRAGRLVGAAPERRSDPHGTATAAEIVRLSPSAELCSIEVLPGGDVVARVVTGLRWVMERRARVVCLAFGLPPENIVLAGLIGELAAAGVLVVAAAGNDGEGTVRQPALLPQVLSVGACDAHGRVARESGSLFDPHSGKVEPDLVAPSSTGTSMACARVAGVAAALWAERPSATAGDVRHALLSTSVTLSRAQRRRASVGAFDATRARAALAKAELGRTLPAGPDPTAHRAWIDPRLRRDVDRARGDARVRAVLLRTATEIVELPASEIAEALEDPRLRAASSATVSVWTLGGGPSRF